MLLLKFTLCALINIFPAAHAINVTKVEKADIKFVAVGKPAMLKITGESHDLKPDLNVENQKISGTISVALKTLDTGISLRDEHMKDKYLEVGKYPIAKLQVKDIALPQPLEKISKTDIDTNGTLSLHGQEKSVPLRIHVETQGEKIQVSATTTIKVSDFSITIPKYMGITVADNVDINVSFPVNLKK
ncbi:MAG: YceI family protein [Bdellovibrionaceae bacterium]|nr:YceI family protein [Pseudobdellovibrionaceae bacterium]